MRRIGQIERPEDPEGSLDLEAWKATRASFPVLRELKPRTGRNPFTAEPTVIEHRDSAVAIVNGVGAGEFRWDPDGPMEVLGDAAVMVPLAEQVAASLGGKFRPDEASVFQEGMPLRRYRVLVGLAFSVVIIVALLLAR
jgi:hypothetical protein